MSVTDAEPIRELMEATRKLEQAYLGSGIPFEIWQKFRGEAGRKVVESLPILLNLIRERGLQHIAPCPYVFPLTKLRRDKTGWHGPKCTCRTDEYMEALG